MRKAWLVLKGPYEVGHSEEEKQVPGCLAAWLVWLTTWLPQGALKACRLLAVELYLGQRESGLLSQIDQLLAEMEAIRAQWKVLLCAHHAPPLTLPVQAVLSETLLRAAELTTPGSCPEMDPRHQAVGFAKQLVAGFGLQSVWGARTLL